MIERAQAREAMRPGAEEPLISIGEAPLDRMPALTLIFEAAVSGFTRRLEEFSELSAALTLEDLDAKRFSDLDEELDATSALLVYDAGGLDAKVAVAVDGGFRDIVLELLLGSTIIERPQGERAATRVESGLVEFAVGIFLDELATAFKPIVAASFRRDACALEPGLAAVAPKAAVSIVSRCRLRALDQEGMISIMLPRSALDPFRAALSRFPGAEGNSQDGRWSENLYDHIVRTEVKVDVKIEARGFTLDDISRLEVGDVLRLPIAPSSPIRVVSEGRTLFWCTLGQKDGHYTVRLEDFSDERQSFIENILGV
jgi:flagellar motor switch protein FliM